MLFAKVDVGELSVTWVEVQSAADELTFTLGLLIETSLLKLDIVLEKKFFNLHSFCSSLTALVSFGPNSYNTVLKVLLEEIFNLLFMILTLLDWYFHWGEGPWWYLTCHDHCWMLMSKELTFSQRTVKELGCSSCFHCFYLSINL